MPRFERRKLTLLLEWIVGLRRVPIKEPAALQEPLLVNLRGFMKAFSSLCYDSFGNIFSGRPTKTIRLWFTSSCKLCKIKDFHLPKQPGPIMEKTVLP